ncbi:hypothetical protein A8B78_04335 [Jannaschia sp. EhC01]|nr:hypothetical protein A8B78_04335 [Jannaschia sp. EhC01]
MTTQRTQETLSRLERLMTQGRFDTARAAIERGSPVLAELGLDDARARQILETSPPQLEAAMNMPVSVLEAIVRATNRPPLIVKNDTVQDKASLIGIFPNGIDGKIAGVEHVLPSVGRIEFTNHDMEWGGTGWVVDKEDNGSFLVITNRHVAKLVARRTHRGDGVFMFGPGNVRYGAAIDFLEELDAQPDPDRVLKIEAFTYIADDAAADVALGRISLPQGDGVPAISPLPRASQDGADEELVAVVGYPAADPFRNDPTEMQNYFKGFYDVKRFSPGFMRVQDGPTILGHDCTTLGGNSGSPVISLESGKAVGLHFAGQYGIGNSAVRISTVNRILDQGAAGDLHAVATPGQPPESSDGRHAAEHFEGRDGYDEMFLQVAPVALPTIPDTVPLSAPTDATDKRPFELRYQHFSILYSGAKKSPVIAALNIDGSQTRTIKRSNKRWYKDLRIPADQQLSREEYGDPEIDRGHMIRRAATNWGASEEIALRSNLDSYHYTVASPQHMGLNRNPATWLGLENYIMENTRTHGFRACVFTGPVFSPDDPPLGQTGALIPLEYFKVVTMLADSAEEDGILRPHATAYVLSQGQLIQRMLADQGFVETAEGFAFGSYRTFQVRLRDLEATTGYDFGPLRDFDPLDRLVGAIAAEGHATVPAFALDILENMVL